MKNAAILLIGGKGERFLDVTTPKQFQFLSGKRVYEFALQTILESQLFDQIILSCHKDWIEKIRAKTHHLHQNLSVIEGGATRQLSVYNALKFLDSTIEKVIVHDGARPFVSCKMLHDLVHTLDDYEACGTYIPSTDTIAVSDANHITAIPDRKSMVRGQTPQGFIKRSLIEAHLKAFATKNINANCDIALCLAQNYKVKMVEGHETNIKITTPIDLFLAEQILRIEAQHSIRSKKIDLQNKRFLIIGGSGGIGSALKHALEKRNAHLICASKSFSEYQLDLTDLKSIEKFFENLHAIYPKIDGCFFAAGMLVRSPIKTLNSSDMEKMVQVNFTSLLHVLKHLRLPPQGLFVLVGSSSYYRGRKEIATYSASKAASINLLQGFAEEHPDLNIQIFCPRRTLTKLRINNFPEDQIEELLLPEDVAEIILQELESATPSGSIKNISENLVQK